MACEYRERVLEYLRGNGEEQDSEKNREVERHLEECRECRALVDGYLEKEKELDIPETGYGGTDERLKERVVHFEKGTRRIIVFTLVGFILGWFSIAYFTDSFLVTKVILAIPYKASEVLHNLFHSHPYSYYNQYGTGGVFMELNEFFPGRGMLTFLAERITPVLLGGAIYGSLAYFTGDSRIFTLRRYLKFAAVWAGVLLLWTGALIKADGVLADKDDRLADVTGFYLEADGRGRGFYERSNPEDDDTIFMLLKEALYQEGNPLKRAETPEREPENEVMIKVFLGKYRSDSMICLVNPEMNYLVTEKSTVYRVPEAFSGYIEQFGEDYFDSLYETYDKEVEGAVEDPGQMED